MTRTITALFDTEAKAEQAARALATEVGGVRGQVASAADQGALGQLGIPAEDMALLRESLARGGAVLHATLPEDRFAAVTDLLEREGALDMDAHEATWRQEGLRHAATAQPAAAAAPLGEEQRIPVVEERLKVGKRETSHGRVRIRSYVVETPVQEQVALRQEHVEVERRPVDRPVAAGDDAFRERVVEATETAEEAVVSKEARVKEEIVLRRQAEERTETVSDRLRETRVEVEDERNRGAGQAPKR